MTTLLKSTKVNGYRAIAATLSKELAASAVERDRAGRSSGTTSAGSLG